MKRSGTPRAKQLRRTMIDAEVAFWNGVRGRQVAGHKFRRQWPVAGYIVDFVCLEARLVVEIDGYQHADNLADVQRTAKLNAQGFRVLRFWNTEVLNNTAGVLDAVIVALQGP